MRTLSLLSLLLTCAALSPQSSAQALLHELASPNEERWGRFGYSVSGVPDVDGDGVDDLLVGAPGEDPGTSPQDAGRAYVFSGATGTLLHTLASPNEQLTGYFGGAVSGVPDVDGDGRGDLLVGAHREASSTGRAYLFSGATGVLLHELASPAPDGVGFFGDAVSGVPDVDGDGRGDLLVGAWAESLGGRAYVFSGASGDLLHALISPNEQEHGSFGFSVAGFSDADGDGAGDFAVGASAEGRGRAYLYSGATGELSYTFSPPVGADTYGYGRSVSGVPDLDGDGRSDLVVGASYGGGRGYVYRGSDGELLHTLVSPDPSTAMGWSVSGVPDLDGDGRGDLLLGAPGASVGYVERAGRAYVFSGATGALLGAPHSPHVRSSFGWSVTGLGDLDGDGGGDFLVGAQADTPGPNPPGAGRAYVFSSTPVEPPPLALSAFAHNTVLPGDSLRFDVAASNPTSEPVTFDLLFSAEEEWWYALSGTLASGITLEPGASTSATYRFFVPEEAVWGSYVAEVEAVSPDSLVVGVTYFPFEVGPDVTAVEPDIEGGDAARALGLAHPNPTRDRATLTLEVGEVQFVTVAVYDALGRRVAVLHEGPLAAGVAYQMVFNGSGLPAGVYAVRAVGETFADTRILTLTR